MTPLNSHTVIMISVRQRIVLLLLVELVVIIMIKMSYDNNDDDNDDDDDDDDDNEPERASPPSWALHTCSAPSRDQPMDEKMAVRYAMQILMFKTRFPTLALTFFERLCELQHYSPAQNIATKLLPRKLLSAFPKSWQRSTLLEPPIVLLTNAFNPICAVPGFWKRIFCATLFLPHFCHPVQTSFLPPCLT